MRDLWNKAFGDEQQSTTAAQHNNTEESVRLDNWIKNQTKQEPLNDSLLKHPHSPVGPNHDEAVRYIPEAAPLQETRPTRPPDDWLIDQTGQRIPTWATEDDSKPKWKSKIFITQAVMFLFAVGSTVFGFNVSLEVQHMILNAALALMGGGSILTVVFRFFFSKKKLV